MSPRDVSRLGVGGVCQLCQGVLPACVEKHLGDGSAIVVIEHGTQRVIATKDVPLSWDKPKDRPTRERLDELERRQQATFRVGRKKLRGIPEGYEVVGGVLKRKAAA